MGVGTTNQHTPNKLTQRKTEKNCQCKLPQYLLYLFSFIFSTSVLLAAEVQAPIQTETVHPNPHTRRPWCTQIWSCRRGRHWPDHLHPLSPASTSPTLAKAQTRPTLTRPPLPQTTRAASSASSPCRGRRWKRPTFHWTSSRWTWRPRRPAPRPWQARPEATTEIRWRASRRRRATGRTECPTSSPSSTFTTEALSRPPARPRPSRGTPRVLRQPVLSRRRRRRRRSLQRQTPCPCFCRACCLPPSFLQLCRLGAWAWPGSRPCCPPPMEWLLPQLCPTLSREAAPPPPPPLSPFSSWVARCQRRRILLLRSLRRLQNCARVWRLVP